MGLRKISQEELERVLADHKRWLVSKGETGERANLKVADLRKVDLCNAVLDEADLRGANLYKADLREANLCEALLDEADLREANLREANLCEANLNRTNLSRANLFLADLDEADLRGANLNRAELHEANLHGADLRGADLRGTDLRGADLRGADMLDASLVDADLRRADLRRANLSEADLRDANLCKADLSGADLSGARLRRADLSWTDLGRSDLRGADLNRADLVGAHIVNAMVSNRAALSSVLGLDDYLGFSFEEDELEQEKDNREKRAKKLFDANKKGTIAFSVPCDLPPMQIGLIIANMGAMVEGVRLALTADYKTKEELAAKMKNPALWTSKEEKYAAKIGSVQIRNPLDVDINTLFGVALFAGFVFKHGAPYLKAYWEHKDRNRIMDMEGVNLPATVDNKLAAELKHASEDVYLHLPEDTKNEISAMIERLNGRVDNFAERSTLASEISLRGLHEFRSLAPAGEASLTINGVPIDLEMPKPEPAPDQTSPRG